MDKVTDICFIAPTEKLALKAKNIIKKEIMIYMYI